MKKSTKGVGPSLMLVSNPSIQFVAYERLKLWVTEQVAKRGNKPPITSLEFFIIGAIAKAVATVFTYPIQLAQTKMRNDKNLSINTNTFEVLRNIYMKDKIAGLFRGMDAKLWQTVLTAAFQFLTYERTHQFVTSILMPDKAKAAATGH